MIKHYKEKAVFLFLALFAFQLVSAMVAPPVAAQAIPDDLCLKVTLTENEQGPLPTPKKFTMNVHLFTVNGTHFTIWGKVVVSGDAPFYVGGTGILESTMVTMNLTTSQKHTAADLDNNYWRDTGIMQVKYNISTNKGTWYEVGHDFATPNRVFDQRYSAGSLVKCP
jgi:hypothetical protein